MMTDQNQCFEPNGDDSIVIEQEDSAHFAPLISPQLFGILDPPPTSTKITRNFLHFNFVLFISVKITQV